MLRRRERDMCHEGTSEKLHYPFFTSVLVGTTWQSVVTFRPDTLVRQTGVLVSVGDLGRIIRSGSSNVCPIVHHVAESL